MKAPYWRQRNPAPVGGSCSPAISRGLCPSPLEFVCAAGAYFGILSYPNTDSFPEATLSGYLLISNSVLGGPEELGLDGIVSGEPGARSQPGGGDAEARGGGGGDESGTDDLEKRAAQNPRGWLCST